MQLFIRLLLVSTAFLLSLCAEGLNPAMATGSAPKTSDARPKPKRLKWLRRICSGEVGLAMKLSGIGIERTATPVPAAAAR